MTPQELFDGNQLLAKKVVAVYRKGHRADRRVPVEELDNAALVGLWKASLRFDAALGHKFSTYAFHMIDGSIRDMLRRDYRPQSRLKHTVTFESLDFYDRHGHKDSFLNENPSGIAVDTEEPWQRQQMRDIIRVALRALPDGQADAVRLRYLHQTKAAEAAKLLGLCQSLFYRRVQNGLKTMLEAVGGREEEVFG